MTNISYFFKEGAKGLKMNPTTTTGSIVTIFLSLLLIGLFVIGNEIVGKVTDAVEDQVAVTAYISDNYINDESAVNNAKSALEQLDGVSNVTLTTKSEALADFKSTLGEDEEEISAQITEDNNPLPGSFKIDLDDTQKVKEVAQEVLNVEAYTTICDNPTNPNDSVKYGQQTVDRLFSVTNIIKTAGTLLVVLLIFIAFVFMNNTIRLAVMNRRKEISIQRLVGANNGFIRGPFFAEGVIHAGIGAIFAIICLELVHHLVLPQISNALPWLPLELDILSYVLLYLLLIVVAVAIGIIGSSLSMKKYLKV